MFHISILQWIDFWWKLKHWWAWQLIKQLRMCTTIGEELLWLHSTHIRLADIPTLAAQLPLVCEGSCSNVYRLTETHTVTKIISKGNVYRLKHWYMQEKQASKFDAEVYVLSLYGCIKFLTYPHQCKKWRGHFWMNDNWFLPQFLQKQHITF